MARPRSRTLTDVELEFMEVLWDRGTASTEDVQAALGARGRELTGGSIRKVLSILMSKGYVARRAEGRSFLYRALVPRHKARRSMLNELLSKAFGGSPALMMATLLDADSVSAGDLEEIRALIEEREQQSRSEETDRCRLNG
jgi:predicted transcriptional regulator